MEQPKFLVGQFLLAMPGIGDPQFEKAVIAMCVHDEDGVVRQLNVEDPGGYNVSSAEHMLGQL